MLIKNCSLSPARPASQRPPKEFLAEYLAANPAGRCQKTIDTIASSNLAASVGEVASLSAGLKALPSFIYPTITNATQAEHARLYEILDRLPLKHVAETVTVSIKDGVRLPLTHKPAGGWALPFGASSIVVVDRGVSQGPDWMPRVLTHEVGHVADFSERDPLWFLGSSRKGHFGEGPFISEYAKTNRREDFADSYEEYYWNGDHLKQVAPEKYKAIEEQSQQTFLQRMVDRKEFRETGKAMAEMAPGFTMRQTARGLAALTSVVQAAHGLANWMASPGIRTPETHATGILDTLAGVTFMTGLAPLLGTGLQGANLALQGALSKNALTPEEVESAISYPVRPIESALGMPTAEIKDEHRPLKVLTVGAGGALGGVVGALAGPYLGVLAGYRVGGGVGGAVGFILGGVAGFTGGSALGGHLGGDIADALTS